MPKSLRQARQEAAALNDELLTELRNADPDEPERPTQATAPGDRVRLRGIPAVGGHGSLGGALRGTVPGSDEHLDSLG